ncbi:hypothetical protein D920_01152 [Enterococcus faecalis 13-SD-W-01]|nr:hypothetical protein D920_01152 [Enterococcus faecalis 13-SD-W-01]
MAKESRRQSAMGYDESNTGYKNSSEDKQNKHEQIKRGKSLEKIEALEAKESRRRGLEEWDKEYREASPTKKKMIDINKNIHLENLNISEWKEKKTKAENQYLDTVADEYVTKINTAKTKIKELEKEKTELQAQLNKEQPKRQASMESLTSKASQQSLNENLPQRRQNPLHREISNLRREEEAGNKKLSEINKEIGKVEALENNIQADKAGLVKISEKITNVSKWGGLRKLWRRIIGKESQKEKLQKYKATVETLEKSIENKNSELKKIKPKHELVAEKSQVKESIENIKGKITLNQEKQRAESKNIQKSKSSTSLERR